MTLQAGDKLMSLADVSEILGIPVHTLYRWRYKCYGPVGYRGWVSDEPHSKASRSQIPRALAQP